jgi:pilus assembly protein CpaE
VPDNVSHYQLVVLIANEHISSLKQSIESLAAQQSNIILIGDNIPNDLLRCAMHNKVRDIISLDSLDEDFFQSVCVLANELIEQSDPAPVFTVINGKSGAGASFITSCLGEVVSSLTDMEIALIDADFHYGSLADVLNLKAEYFLNDALAEIDKLDDVAIKSMMSKRANLNLLPVEPYSILADNLNRLEELIWKVKLNHKLILVDLSRGLEQHTLPLIHLSSNLLIVVQQNIVSLREGKALICQLTEKLGIDSCNIHVIVNRYSSKNNNISIDDVKNALGVDSVYKVNNNYELASSCTDLGAPLLKLSDSKAMRQDISIIAKQVLQCQLNLEQGKRSFFSKLFKGS